MLEILIPLVIVTLCVGVVVWVVLLSRRGGASTSKGERELARCGQCGYPAEGVGSFECPECGGDLRRVGILPPGVRVRSMLPVVLILWTLGMLVGGGALGSLLSDTLLPHVRSEEAELELSNPESGAYQRVEVRRFASLTYLPIAGRSPVAMPPDAVIHIVGHDGRVESVVLTPDNRTYRRQGAGPDTQVKRPFDVPELLKIMSDMGIDVQAPTIQAEAERILVEAKVMTAPTVLPSGSSSSSGGSGGKATFNMTGSSSSTFSGPAPWATPLLFLLFFALWVYGCVRIVRRSGRHAT